MVLPLVFTCNLVTPGKNQYLLFKKIALNGLTRPGKLLSRPCLPPNNIFVLLKSSYPTMDHTQLLDGDDKICIILITVIHETTTTSLTNRIITIPRVIHQ